MKKLEKKKGGGRAEPTEESHAYIYISTFEERMSKYVL